MPDQRKTAASLAWLWSFLAFFALGLISLVVKEPFYYRPNPVNEEAAGRQPARGSAVVLSFYEVEGAPGAVRREATEHGADLVFQLGADANHLGGVNGSTLAQALAQELSARNLFETVRYAENEVGLGSEAYLIRGKVLEASFRMRQDGKAQYEVAVELSAGQSVPPDSAPLPPTWQGTFRRKLALGNAAAAYEVNDLLRAVFAEAADKLAGDFKGEPQAPPLPVY